MMKNDNLCCANKQRNAAIDLLKIVALFLMIFDHAYILLLKQPQPQFLRFFYEIVPLSPALFLFLSGYSLAVSGAYLKRKKRLIYAGVYFAVSNIFFIAEHGIQFPHFPFATGILSTIALLSVFCVGFGFFSEKAGFFVSAALSIILTTVFVALRMFDLKIFPLTFGYEPLFPTFLFGIIGFSIGQGKKFLAGWLLRLVPIVAAVAFVAMTIFCGTKMLFVSSGCYQVSYVFKYSNLIQNLPNNEVGGKYSVSIWNFDVGCFFYVLSIVVLLVFLSEKLLCRIKINAIVLLPARYLFVHYVLHLGVLTLIYILLNGKMFSSAQFSILIALMTAAIYLVSVLLDKAKRKFHQGISPV